MTLEQANKQARNWWGDNGSVEVRGLRSPHKYVVGTSILPSRLGGHVSAVYGASWKSFEAAFANAILSGHIPGTGFEEDEAIESEA